MEPKEIAKVSGVKRIKILTVIFDTDIQSFEIPAFRGAIVDKVGKNNILFHNHLNDNSFLYKYPLIQYKNLSGRPAIICIDYGVDEIHKFFNKEDWNVQVSGRWLEMKILKLSMNQFNMQIWSKKFQYTIFNWIALNQENFNKYLGLPDEKIRIDFLENVLKANILSFAKGIDWTIERRFDLNIDSVMNTHPVKLKGKSVLGFTVNFSTNVFLPNNIGLGKSVSLGYGVVHERRKKIPDVKPE